MYDMTDFFMAFVWLMLFWHGCDYLTH